MYIDSQFLTQLAEADLTASTYKIALYLPKLLQQGQVDFSNSTKNQEFIDSIKTSKTSLKRAIKVLEELFIIIPVEEKSNIYYCNPYLIWDGSFVQPEYERAYKNWNIIIKPRILAALEKSKQQREQQVNKVGE